MARIELDDGTEVFTSDEPVTKPEGKFSGMRAAARKRNARPNNGLTGRQKFESDTKRIVKGLWEYVSGDGDDFERARSMLGGGEPDVVLPDDD